MATDMKEASGIQSRIVALCGKGGVGKTALSAMIGRVLIESGQAGRLLLIDADPAMGLIAALGVSVRRTMGQVREEIIDMAKSADKSERNRLVGKLDYMVMEALAETEAFALLAMGRTDTLGCFCPVNDLLRSSIETLSKSFDTILIDCEAGLEQLNRQIVRQLDTLIIVSDPSSRGLQTAQMIRKMVEDDKVIDCRNMGLTLNRVTGNKKLLANSARDIGLRVLGYVPQDEAIAHYDLTGKPILALPSASPALQAVREIANRDILRNGYPTPV